MSKDLEKAIKDMTAVFDRFQIEVSIEIQTFAAAMKQRIYGQCGNQEEMDNSYRILMEELGQLESRILEKPFRLINKN